MEPEKQYKHNTSQFSNLASQFSNLNFKLYFCVMEKIDLVYTWVDGNDAAWQQSKQEWLARSGGAYDRQSTAKGRFVDNEELRYSLRSVEQNMSWINRIHIVTADQTPEWLNTKHPKIHLVSHRDIFPAECLPTFNSSAIDMALPNIEGLAERFILSNDDMFVVRPVTPDFFYTDKGLPIARFGRVEAKGCDLYQSKIRNMQELVEERCGRRYRLLPHHCMDGYLLSDIRACADMFAERVAATRANRFRSKGEIQRAVWYYWAMANGRAEQRIVGRWNGGKSVWERLGCLLSGHYCMDSKPISIHRGGLAKSFRKYNPTLLCLNDTELATDVHRVEARAFMEWLFPTKSSFEK